MGGPMGGTTVPTQANPDPDCQTARLPDRDPDLPLIMGMRASGPPRACAARSVAWVTNLKASSTVCTAMSSG
eukprot:14906672-Alexandrium_andersonii.AAC.1